MQISSSYSFRIPVQLNSSSSGTTDSGDISDLIASDEKPKSSSSAPNTGLQLDTSSRSLQSALSQLGSSSRPVNENGVPTTTVDGKYLVTPRDPTGQVMSPFADLYGSDIELIEKATGVTYADGEFTGGDQGGINDLIDSLRDMRKQGTGAMGAAKGITTTITADQFADFIKNRAQQIGNYHLVDNALAVLQSDDAST